MSNDREGVIGAFMIETPATAPVFARSINARLTGRVEEIYRETSDGGRKNSESLMASIANSVLGYSTEPERRISMPGGFDQSRFRVVIEYRESAMNRTEKISYIVGYTDHDDMERDGGSVHFDKRMKVYFNNVALVTRSTGTRTGAQAYRVDNRSQILTAPDVGEKDILDEVIASRRRKDRSSSYSPMDGHLLIPSIVIGRMGNAHIPDLVGMPNIRRSDIEDSRSSLRTLGAKRTNGMNAVPAHYLSRVLEGHSQVRRGNQASDNDGPRANTKRIADLQREVEDDTLSNSGFFHTLMVDTHFPEDGYVTWGELIKLFPELDDDRIVTALPLAKRYKDRPSVDNVSHWDSTDMETIIANILVSSITPMLSELLFDEVDISITNDTRDGKVSVVIEHYYSMFGDLDLIAQAETLEFRIRRWVLDGQPWMDCPIDIHGTLSTNYECALNIEYDGGRPESYRFASYADARGSALISIDEGKIDAISDSLGTLMGIIDEKYEESTESRLIIPRMSDRDFVDSDRTRSRNRDRGRDLILPTSSSDSHRNGDDRRTSVRKRDNENILSSLIK